MTTIILKIDGQHLKGILFVFALLQYLGYPSGILNFYLLLRKAGSD
jgi:hypothetical protein